MLSKEGHFAILKKFAAKIFRKKSLLDRKKISRVS
jgi:hypothetical protein